MNFFQDYVSNFNKTISKIKENKDVYEVIVMFGGLFNLSVLIFSIIDMVSASSWKSCHLKYVDIVIYLFGSLGFAYLILVSCRTMYTYVMGGICIFCGFCVLFWGMSILMGSEKGDCKSIDYKYAYYRTIITLVIWSLYLIFLIGGFLIYNYMNLQKRKIAEINVV